jgi:hypothetical protein
MTPSSGNQPQRPAGESLPQSTVPAPAPTAPPGPKPAYRKPELKRLGLLRSVTGSDRVW